MRQTWRGLCTHGSKVPDAPSPSGAPLSGRGRRSTLPEQRGLAYSPLSEARRDGQEELPHVQGAVAAQAQEGLEELSSVWREDPGLLSRPCRKRRPSAREDGKFYRDRAI